MKKGAFFSKDKKYRYLLTRSWDKTKPSCCFICINPSKANDTDNDNTVTSCINKAKDLGFGSIEMVNLFGLVDTNRDLLYEIKDPVGPENDKYLKNSVNRCDKIIVAWGNGGNYMNRDMVILEILKKSGKTISCLAKNDGGQPRHPGRMGIVKNLIKYN